MSARRNFEWPELLTADGRGIAFGGDYNPDQWSEDIWDDDIRLMEKAGVNTVALAIFSWDRIQPTEDRWNFGWLDRIIEKLGKAGIATDLASATATAPLWLYESHPEVLPRDKYGHPVNAGSRQSWSPTSPVFKEYALTLCRKLAERYGTNPYVNRMAHGQRIRVEQPRGLLRQCARGLPRMVPPQVRHHRRAQPGVGAPPSGVRR